MSIQVAAIDMVIKNTLEVMDESKYQVYEICEGARSEREAILTELEKIKVQIKNTIDRVDRLELDFKNSRVRLSEVSRFFSRYKEDDIRKAYEVANNYQLDLRLFKEKEANLRQKRDDLAFRLRNIEITIERAENVVAQMGVVHQYLAGDLSQVGKYLESAKSRQMLGLRIILAQEEERKRIAREIHDGLAQSMASLVLRSEITERMLDRKKIGEAKQEVQELKSQMRQGLEEVRKIIFNLRPMALDDLGIVPALRKFAHDFEEKYRIKTKFEFIGREIRLTSAMEVAIFRFVQEAFSNILKHSGATEVVLKMTFQPERIKISINDNGVGFDKQVIDEKVKTGVHFGLVGMQERVDLIEGQLEISSKLGKGTSITVTVPIEMAKVESKE